MKTQCLNCKTVNPNTNFCVNCGAPLASSSVRTQPVATKPIKKNNRWLLPTILGVLTVIFLGTLGWLGTSLYTTYQTNATATAQVEAAQSTAQSGATATVVTGITNIAATTMAVRQTAGSATVSAQSTATAISRATATRITQVTATAIVQATATRSAQLTAVANATNTAIAGIPLTREAQPDRVFFKDGAIAYGRQDWKAVIDKYTPLEAYYSDKLTDGQKKEVAYKLTESYCNYALQTSEREEPIEQVYYYFKQCFEDRDSSFLPDAFLGPVRGRYEAEKKYRESIQAISAKDWTRAIGLLEDLYKLDPRFRDTTKRFFDSLIAYGIKLRDENKDFDTAISTFEKAEGLQSIGTDSPEATRQKQLTISMKPTPNPPAVSSPPGVYRPIRGFLNKDGAEWYKIDGGFVGSSLIKDNNNQEVDSFCRLDLDIKATNFIFESKIAITKNKGSSKFGGLVFGTNSDLRNDSYSVGFRPNERLVYFEKNPNGTNKVKSTYKEALSDSYYTLKVEVSSGNLNTYIDGNRINSSPINIPAIQYTYFGLNSEGAEVTFTDISITVRS